jgi:uncharacterized protein DUF4136
MIPTSSIRRTLIWLSALVLALASGLAAQQVTYNYMPGTDFSKYHSFKWVDIPSNMHPNRIVDQEIKDAVNNLLAAKWVMPVSGDTADLYVGYQCSVDQERRWNAWGGSDRFMGAIAQATSPTISNGTFAIDFYDPASKQLIWRGSATKTLNPSGNQQKDIEKLNKGIAKLLKNFPPSKK